MRREWQYVQLRVEPTTPRAHEVVVSLAENEEESPAVATIMASGVCREYDARKERKVAEACNLVMESLDKVSLTDHPSNGCCREADHGLEPPGPHLETRRHGLGRLQRQHSRGSSFAA